MVKSGLLNVNSELAREVKSVTETFVRLAQTVATEGHSELEESSGDAEIDPATEWYKAATAARSPSIPFPTQPANSAPEYRDIGMGYSAVITDHSPPAQSQAPLYESSLYLPDPRRMSSDFWRRSNVPRPRPTELAVNSLREQSKFQEENPPVLPFGIVEISRAESTAPQVSLAQSVSNSLLPSPPPTRLPSPPSLSQVIESNSLRNRTLPSPYTYSFEESSFARRLTRASIESGFRLLSDPTPKPSALKHIFQLSLPFRSIHDLRERFRTLLSKGPHDPLELWDAPFLHIGGAGTHYPRKDAFGNPIPLMNSWTVKRIGPQRKAIVENTADPSQVHNLPVDLSNFEGIWFDPNDVQGYLEEEKGLVLNGHETFAECLVEVDEETVVRSDSSISSGKSINSDASSNIFEQLASFSNPSSNNTTPQSSESPFGLDMTSSTFQDTFKLSDLDTAVMYEQPLALDLSGGFDTTMNVGLTDFGDLANLGMDLMGPTEQLPVVKQKQKKPMLIDVSKLIEGSSFYVLQAAKRVRKLTFGNRDCRAWSLSGTRSRFQENGYRRCFQGLFRSSLLRFSSY